MSDEKKSFIKVTWQQIVAGAISLIILGVLGYVGTIVNESIDQANQNKEDIRVINTILETDLRTKLSDLDNTLKEYNTRMGSTNAQLRQLEIMINRLDVVIDRLDTR